MRRREKPRPVATKVQPPAWVRALGAGIVHVTGSLTTEDLVRDRALLEVARARWCAKNGCYRQGETCREAYGEVPGRCREAGGPAEQGQG